MTEHVEQLKEIFKKKNYTELGKLLNSLSEFDDIQSIMNYFFKSEGFKKDYFHNTESTSYKAFFEQITPFIQKRISQTGSLNTLFSLDEIFDLYVLAYNENALDLASSIFLDIKEHENNDTVIFNTLLPKLLGEHYYSQGDIKFVQNKLRQEKLDSIFLDCIAHLNLDLSNTVFSDYQFKLILNNKDKNNNVLKIAVDKGLKLTSQWINTPYYMAQNKNPLLLTIEISEADMLQFSRREENDGLNSYLQSNIELIENLEQIKKNLGDNSSHLTEIYRGNELIYKVRSLVADILTNENQIKQYRVNPSFDDELLGQAFHQIKYVSTDSWINGKKAHKNLKPYKDVFYFLVDKAFSHTIESGYGTNINSFYLSALNSYMKQNNDQIEVNKELNQSVLMTYLARFSDAVGKEQQAIALIDRKIYSSRLFRFDDIYKTQANILSHLYRTNKESFFAPINVELFNNQGVIVGYNKFAKTHGLSEVSMIETQGKFSKFMNFFSSSKKEKNSTVVNEVVEQENVIQENKGYSINYLRMHELLDHPKMDIEIFLNINALYAKSKFLSLVFQEDKVIYIEPKILVKKTFEDYLPQILFNYIQSLNVNSQENFKEQTLEQINLLSDKILTIENQVKNTQHNEVSTSISETGEFLKSKLAHDASLSEKRDNYFQSDNLNKNSLKIGQ